VSKKPSIEDIHARLLNERADDQSERDAAASDLRRRLALAPKPSAKDDATGQPEADD